MLRYLAEGVPAAQAAELTAAARFTTSVGSGDSVPSRDVKAAKEGIRAALVRFDETSAQRTLERLFAAFTPTTVTRDVLLPYMHEVGEQWSAGRASIAQEHFTTNFFQGRLYALARGWDRGLGPRALLACAPEEQHTLALMVFGIALHELGWRITYLGPDTPIATLTQVAELIHPQITVVAAAMAKHVNPHVESLTSFSAQWSLAMAGAGVSVGLAQQVGAWHLDLDPVSAATTVSL